MLIVAFVAWAIYRRARRSIGRQQLQIVRLQVRAGVLAVVGVLALAASAVSINLLAALLGGVAAGALLATVGLRHTKFESTPDGQFYTPHTYIGLLVSALFIARLLYRFLTLNAFAQAVGQASLNPFAQYQRSPLTLSIFGVVVGYYVVFNLGVIRKSRELGPPLV